LSKQAKRDSITQKNNTMLQETNNLKLLYSILKEQFRNHAKRRFYYRKIEKEKLRLSELGTCQECIKNYCLYLSSRGLKRQLKTCKTCQSGQLSIRF
jgi:hypothetical protein